MPEIESVASASNHPFSNSQSTTSWEHGEEKRPVRTEVARASSSFAETMGLQLIAGRWFVPADGVLEWEPVVIDRLLAEELVGDGDPIGRTIDTGSERGEVRVVGVISGFQRGGPFAEPTPFMFRYANEERDDGYATNRLIVRLQEGTSPDFEERMLNRLQSIGKGWTFTVLPLVDSRKAKMQERLVPLAIVGTVGAFLLIMVVLGLTGVMWQNVIRRTREVGLRRAAGANRASIHRQIVLEVMITALFGVALGVAIAVQVPVVGPFTFVPFGVVLQGIVVSSLFMLVLAAMCGLYPGWSATRIHPAEALHYE